MAVKRPLTVATVVAWADEHYARMRRWPNACSGAVASAAGENWLALNSALVHGFRGLPGGDSLARLLARERGMRNFKDLPPLREDQILAWADAHHARTGEWPTVASGPVLDAPGESWGALHSALYEGHRGLPGWDTLPRLLVRHGRLPKLWMKKRRNTRAAGAPRRVQSAG